jgi:hypothetical protein
LGALTPETAFQIYSGQQCAKAGIHPSIAKPPLFCRGFGCSRVDASLGWHDEMGDFSSLEQVKWLIKFIPDSSAL